MPTPLTLSLQQISLKSKVVGSAVRARVKTRIINFLDQEQVRI